MTVVCLGPDTALGVAYRLSAYLDCQARALGENGFQAVAGGAMGTALLTGLITVFIALIGYRLLLGHMPDVRDGVGWAVHLGIVLALVTSWPAFQALVYRVAVDAPPSIAAVLLPASGLAASRLTAPGLGTALPAGGLGLLGSGPGAAALAARRRALRIDRRAHQQRSQPHCNGLHDVTSELIRRLETSEAAKGFAQKISDR